MKTTLFEFSEMFYCNCDEPTIYVFDSESNLTDFAEKGSEWTEGLLFVINTQYSIDYFLKQVFCDAVVRGFYAIKTGVIACWIAVLEEGQYG